MSIAAVLIVSFAGATAYDRAFDESVAAHDRGEFAVAVRTLEQIVDEGVEDARVFYNLGNAYYRLGLFGEAIANYERATRIDPNFEDAHANLFAVVSQCPRGLARPLPPEWQRAILFWHGGIAQQTSGVVAAVAWIAGWLLFALRRVRPLPYLRGAALFALLTGVLFGASWYAKEHPQSIAVTTPETLEVRYGPAESDKVRFELFVGDRVLVEAVHGEWARIETVGRERGWTRLEGLVMIGPPYRGFGAGAQEPSA